MNAARLSKYEELLNQLRVRLNGDVTDLARDIEDNQASLKNHEAYVADEIETNIMLGKNEEAMLVEVQAALARIRNGNFGVCQDCSGSIPAARLNVIPFTAVCVGCEEVREAS